MDGFTVVRAAPGAAPKGFTVISPPPKKTARRTSTQTVAGALANVNRGATVLDEVAGGLRAGVNLVTGKERFDPVSAAGGVLTGLAGGFQNPVSRALMQQSGIPQATERAMKVQRATEDDFAGRHPKSAALARGTGNALTVLAPGGPVNSVFANATRTGNVVRGAVSGGLNAAAYTAADRGSPQERLHAATRAARDPLALGLGAVGGAMLPARARPQKPVDADVRLLAEEGVRMTPGQMRGGLAKSAEDAATSLPILGDAIQAARQGGIEGFNRAAVNRALAPVDDALPEGLVGYDAVKYAQEALSRGYDDVLPTGGVIFDDDFAREVRGIAPIIDTLTPQNQQRLQKIIDSRLMARLETDNGVLSGDIYKRVQSELGRETRRFTSSTDADERAIGEALGVVMGALKGAAGRQNPEFAARLQALDQGYANLVRAEGAASKTGAEAGVFTPAQYDQAVRAADSSTRKRRVASGEALGQDLATAGRAVLPSKLPDSGTAKRAFLGYIAAAPGAALGAGFGGALGAMGGIAATGLTLAGASRAYSPQAIEAANRALSERIGRQESAAALEQLRQIALRDPKAQELYRLVADRLSRSAGAAGAANSQTQSVLSASSQ